MKRNPWFRTTVAVWTLLILGSAAVPAAELKVSPSTITQQLRQSGKMTVTMPTIALRPRARAEILFAWWCWHIDPRPPECEVLVCGDPIPKDPLCPRTTKILKDGTLLLEFDGPGLLKKAGSACGPVGFSIMARLEDGSKSEATGKVTVECELGEELTKLEKLGTALKRGGSSEKTLREMHPVNERLKAIARELESLFHAREEEAGEQAAKEFFSECTGLGTRLDAALNDKSNLPEVHKAVISVVKKGRDMAVFEPNDPG